MPGTVQPLTSIQIRGHGKRRVAEALVKAHPAISPPSAPATAIRIVCISDTHNKLPTIPPGDVLLHAGDLTENGSFDEVQDGLMWLSSQPHRHKILVAGNHDVLLDDVFLDKYPERRYDQTKTKQDLDWGSVIHLQDSTVTLDFAVQDQRRVRQVTVFGSPWTPRYGISAFQYPPSDSQHWEDIFSSLDQKPQVVVTHGPPRLHLDKRDFHRAGCPYLAEQIYRIRPSLHVFGHIHASYGQEAVLLSGVQRAYQEVMIGWGGWGTLMWMAMAVAWARVKHVFRGVDDEGATTFVNASIVGGPQNELRNAPIVVDI